MNALLILIQVVFLIMGLWFTIQFSLYLYSRSCYERFYAALARLDDAARTTVREVEQTISESMRRARVDHKIKGDTEKGVRSAAMKILLENLGPLGLKELRKALG